VPVCVVFPNTYYIGMSNLAVHLLYAALNASPEVVCERLFLDEGEKPVSVESGRPLSSFEIIFFTLSFEMDYPNIPAMLRRAAVTVAARDRGDTEPLVVGGGMCVMANPEPLAHFFDLFLMGDVEACIPAFLDRYLAVRGAPRQDVVEALSAWRWAYNPAGLDVSYGDDGTVKAFTPPGSSVAIERYTGKRLAASSLRSSDTEFADMLLVEGTRGCPSRCAFCLTGNVYPFVADRLEKIDGDIKDVGIIGGGVSFHPRLTEIVKRLTEQGLRVHLPSLRLDEVPLDVIRLLKDSIKTLTFGIEAAGERLRRCIGKPITDEEIYDRIAAIAEVKSFHFKFYFMVGLPGEGRQDVEAIGAFIRRILHVLVKRGSAKGRIGSITVHASPFVPKASTPFQWMAMNDMRELKEKIAILKRELGKVPNTHFTHESVKYSFLQGVFARGDRRVKDVILDLAEGGNLTRIMRESPVNLNFYATRERGRDEIFPWDFIRGRTDRTALYHRLESCLKHLR
jgi:radical SAM superfamily enzyme YgiQ (UPF0313 family)